MQKLNINCNGINTIQDTIKISDGLANELQRSIKEHRQPKFSLIIGNKFLKLN